MRNAHDTPAKKRWLTSTLVALVGGGLAIGGAAAPAAQAVEPAAHSAPGPADGLYHFVVGDSGQVLAKSTTCDQGAGGTYVSVPRDQSKFSQKWSLIKQPNGTYVIASACQPTVLWTDDPVGYIGFQYGTDGPVGALGGWDPGYDYRVAHSAEQEWYITDKSVEWNRPGIVLIESATTPGKSYGVILSPTS